MRILHVLTYYWPHWTGLTKYAQRLAEGLAGRGHQVSVLTSRFSSDLPVFENHRGVTIHRVPTLARVSRGVLMPSFPMAAWTLIGEHDMVQVHLPLLETWLVGALARRRGKPMVATNHGDLIMPAGAFNQLVQWSVRAAMARGLRQAAVITTHSQDYADHSDFLRPFASKVRVAFPPVAMASPDPRGVEDLRGHLGLPDGPIVGFAGRFVEEKGFDFLLQAIPLVAAQIPNVRFAFAGDRFVAYENFYHRWAHLVEEERSRLVIAGLLRDEQELANFYGLCDALAIPSRTDCFPSVQVEAMLCGTPVVTADIPGARVPIQLTGAGRLVAAGDPQALADGLVAVLRSPGGYQKPRDGIERLFGVEQSIDVYEALLAELVSGSQRFRDPPPQPSPAPP